MQSLILDLLKFIGLLMILKQIIPPLHLINHPQRKELEKKVENLSNFKNLSRKQRFKVVCKILLGGLLIGVEDWMQYFSFNSWM